MLLFAAKYIKLQQFQQQIQETSLQFLFVSYAKNQNNAAKESTFCIINIIITGLRTKYLHYNTTKKNVNMHLAWAYFLYMSKKYGIILTSYF